jgi:hypothetical protein
VPPPGKFAYATNAQDGSLRGYAVDQNNGSLTPLQNIPSGQIQSVFANDPNGRALYNLVGSSSPGCSDLRIWTIDSAQSLAARSIRLKSREHVVELVSAFWSPLHAWLRCPRTGPCVRE